MKIMPICGRITVGRGFVYEKKVLLIFCFVFMLSSCSLTKKKQDAPIELTPQQVLDKLQDTKQNSFLLYLTADDCYSCSEYQKVIDDLEKSEPFKIYYLKIDPNEDDTTKKLLNELQITTGKYFNLPMTYYFYQGTLLPENKKDGYLKEKDLRTWLQNLHIIH